MDGSILIKTVQSGYCPSQILEMGYIWYARLPGSTRLRHQPEAGNYVPLTPCSMRFWGRMGQWHEFTWDFRGLNYSSLPKMEGLPGIQGIQWQNWGRFVQIKKWVTLDLETEVMSRLSWNIMGSEWWKDAGVSGRTVLVLAPLLPEFQLLYPLSEWEPQASHHCLAANSQT